jgi:hypothetical protein
MSDEIQQVLQLADDLKPWAPIATQAIRFGVKQATAIARRFHDRYAHDAPETREQALQNGADAAQRLRGEVDARVERGELTEAQARASFQRPDIAKHAQDVLLVASETPDELNHEELARLMGAQLVAPQESRENILLRMACDQLQYLTSRQLRLLGLIFAICYMGPDDEVRQLVDVDFDAAFTAYTRDMRTILGPFSDLDITGTLDAEHFNELLLIVYNPTALAVQKTPPQGLSPGALLQPLFNWFYVKTAGTVDPIFTQATKWYNGTPKDSPIKHMRMTPVGYLIGYCMYCIARGIPFVLNQGWWDSV